MERLELTKYGVDQLDPNIARDINGGLESGWGYIIDGILEIGERIHESYTSIKKGFVDGWNECTCQ